MVGIGFCFRHDLDADAPPGKIAVFDGFKEVALRAFAVSPDDLRRLRVRPCFDALHGFEMELDPKAFIVGIDEAVGVAAVAIDESIALRQTAVAHEYGDLVQAFGRERPEIPHGGIGAHIGFGIALLRMNEIAEFIGIAHEENRRVVADHVPVAFFGIELDGETADIAFGIGGAALASDG